MTYLTYFFRGIEVQSGGSHSVEIGKIYSHQKNIPSNQLFSKKRCFHEGVRVNFRNFYTVGASFIPQTVITNTKAMPYHHVILLFHF